MRKSKGAWTRGLMCGMFAGIAIGALAILGLEEEPRKRLEYTISELKEMPFRIFI